MSEIKYYDGGYKDIIISIPTNTIEMTVEQCCEGEYPVYTLTEKGEEYVERLYGERMVDDGEDD